MKNVKAACKALLIAVLAIAVWESAWHWLTPERHHARHLQRCVETYAEYEEVLRAVLPRPRDQEAPSEEPQMILDPLYAYVRGESPDDRLIGVPLVNFGDFYRYTYTYGLIWAADYDLLLAKNPDLILLSLEDGWCAYASISPQ